MNGKQSTVDGPQSTEGEGSRQSTVHSPRNWLRCTVDRGLNAVDALSVLLWTECRGCFSPLSVDCRLNAVDAFFFLPWPECRGRRFLSSSVDCRLNAVDVFFFNLWTVDRGLNAYV
jgi:hypothetical protein